MTPPSPAEETPDLDRLRLLTRVDFRDEEWRSARTLIALGLQEDLADRGDVTSQLLIPERQQGQVAIVARQAGVLSGLPLAWLVLQQMTAEGTWHDTLPDGTALVPGQTVAVLTGSVRQLLTAERTMLNFLTHLSGIATLTQQYVGLVQGTQAQILDTRKTHPGYRVLEKYAVRCGGGSNHRMGLYDGVMIKDNHLAARRAQFPGEAPARMIELVRQAWPELPLTVEVDTLTQLEDLLPGGPDIILLDNMTCPQMEQAVRLRDRLSPGTLLEASGGVNLSTVAGIAQTGVDRISIGALTHSAPAFDLGFDWT